MREGARAGRATECRRSHGRETPAGGQERIAFSATAVLDRRDFGLTWNQALETGGVLVGNEVRITIQLQAVQGGEEAS